MNLYQPNEPIVVQNETELINDSRKGTPFFELSTRIKENGRIPWLSVGDRILTKADSEGIFHCFVRGCSYSSNMKDTFRKHIQRGPHDRFDLPLGCSRPVEIVFTDLVIDNRYNVMVCLSCSMIVEPNQFSNHCKSHGWVVNDFDQHHLLSDRELLLKKIENFGKYNNTEKRMNYPVPIKGLETHVGLSCALCDEIFQDVKDTLKMQNHHNEKHSDQPVQFGYTITYQKLFLGENEVVVRLSKFLCTKCGSVLPSELDLGLHIAWYHQQDVCIKLSKDSTIPGKKSGDIISQTKDNNDNFHCIVTGCMFKTRSSEAFKLHVIEFPHDLTPEQLSAIERANNPLDFSVADSSSIKATSSKDETRSSDSQDGNTSLENSTRTNLPINKPTTTNTLPTIGNVNDQIYTNNINPTPSYNHPKNNDYSSMPGTTNGNLTQTKLGSFLETTNSGPSGYNSPANLPNRQLTPMVQGSASNNNSLPSNGSGAIPIRGAETKTSEHYCTTCEKNYDSSISLLRHMTSRHSKEVSAKLTSKSNVPGYPIGHTFTAKRIDDNLKCSIPNCDFSTQRSDAWRKHVTSASHVNATRNAVDQSFQPPYYAKTKLVVDTYYGLTICTECGCGVPLANLEPHCQTHGWAVPVLVSNLLEDGKEIISTKGQFYQILKKLHFNKFTGKQEDAKAVSCIPVLDLIICNNCHSYFPNKKEFRAHFVAAHPDLPFIDKLSKRYQKVFNDDHHYLRIQD